VRWLAGASACTLIRADETNGANRVSKGRLEAFSDGVIAVAITLLALDLSVPGPGHGSLLTLVGDRWPEFAAYAVSFLLIGIIWVNHHARFNLIAYVDRTLLFLNLVLLLFVVLIPFATATVAAYLTSNTGDSHVAMALYAVVLEGMALSFGAIFEWSLGEGRSTVQVPRHLRREARIRTSVGEVVYVIVFVVAFISAPIALAITALTGVYYVFAPLPRVPQDVTGISE
jgi:TMEM175 potassium channel family protein